MSAATASAGPDSDANTSTAVGSASPSARITVSLDIVRRWMVWVEVQGPVPSALTAATRKR